MTPVRQHIAKPPTALGVPFGFLVIEGALFNLILLITFVLFGNPNALYAVLLAPLHIYGMVYAEREPDADILMIERLRGLHGRLTGRGVRGYPNGAPVSPFETGPGAYVP